MITAGTGRPPRRPQLVVAALFVGVLAALVLVIAGAHVRPSGHAHPPHGVRTVGPGQVVTQSSPSGTNSSQQSLHPSVLSDAAGIVAAVAGLLVIVAGLLILLRLILGALGWSGFRRRRPAHVAAAEFAPEDLVEQMGSAVDEAMDELLADRPVSDAIILCWQRLERTAEDAGIAAKASDTPEEAINRVFTVADVRAEPLQALATLYREARFSRHALGDADIEAARAALIAILDDLRNGTRATT